MIVPCERAVSHCLSARFLPPFALDPARLLLALPLVCMFCLAQQAQPADVLNVRGRPVCTVLADGRTGQPVRAILEEYGRRTGDPVEIHVLPADQLGARVREKPGDCHVAVVIQEAGADETPVSSLEAARRVAWKHPSGEPVWAAVVSDHPAAETIVRFLGGPTGHRFWSGSDTGFAIVSGESRAEAYQWVVEKRTARTYPLTAMRMLRECGGIRDGVCIDIGCGSGRLDVELAKRANFTITGLDIDPEVQPLFERTVREAGFEDRISFVLGDAQHLPFADDSADVIVSRGTLTFIPDIARCLREVDRVLKPSGVAFLGGRYLYTPQAHKVSTDTLRRIVDQSGVAGAEVIDARGQWVKIVGPEAPPSAREFQGGPDMLAGRFVVDYGVTGGKCLLIHRGDGDLDRALQQGFLDMTECEITALYPAKEQADSARRRLRQTGSARRIDYKVGEIEGLPFDDGSFDAVAGVGPVLIWSDHVKAMREIHRVLRTGGAALVGGRYLHMPEFRRVSSDQLRQSAAATHLPGIRVMDDMGQWVEIRKGIAEWELSDSLRSHAPSSRGGR